MERRDSVESLAERLRERSARLNAARVLQEPRPSSRVPVLGPLIAKLRQLFGRLATRWYVAPLLDQQQRFNQEVAAAFDELAEVLVAQEQQVDQIVRQQPWLKLNALEQTLRDVSSRLAALHQQQQRLAVVERALRDLSAQLAAYQQQQQRLAVVEQILRDLSTQLDALRQMATQGEGFTITLEYPLNVRPRYGYGNPPHPQLYEVIEQNREVYAARLAHFLQVQEGFLRIPRVQPDERPFDPHWISDWLTGLDAVAIYGFLCKYNPQRFWEIGSGTSTKFARRAIGDHGLRTTITSIDPHPRSEIDSICDRIIRQPVENVDPEIFDQLEAGDILFIDHSHYVFMNSDATVVFLDILPRLKPGVLVEFHDIFLPYDYLPEWIERYYSEQYVLAAYLLAQGSRFEIVLPNYFISQDPELSRILTPLWNKLELKGRQTEGVSFWIQVR